MSRFDTDIVERLLWDRRYTNGHVPLTLHDAADMIERLRKALKPFADITELSPIGDGQIDRVYIEVSISDINEAQAALTSSTASPAQSQP